MTSEKCGEWNLIGKRQAKEILTPFLEKNRDARREIELLIYAMENPGFKWEDIDQDGSTGEWSYNAFQATKSHLNGKLRIAFHEGVVERPIQIFGKREDYSHYYLIEITKHEREETKTVPLHELPEAERREQIARLIASFLNIVLMGTDEIAVRVGHKRSITKLANGGLEIRKHIIGLDGGWSVYDQASDHNEAFTRIYGFPFLESSGDCLHIPHYHLLSGAEEGERRGRAWEDYRKAKKQPKLMRLIYEGKKSRIKKYLSGNFEILLTTFGWRLVHSSGGPDSRGNGVSLIPDFRFADDYKVDFLVLASRSCALCVDAIVLESVKRDPFSGHAVAERIRQVAGALQNWLSWAMVNFEHFSQLLRSRFEENNHSVEFGGMGGIPISMHFRGIIFAGTRAMLSPDKYRFREQFFDRNGKLIEIVPYDRLAETENDLIEMGIDEILKCLRQDDHRPSYDREFDTNVWSR